MMEAPLNSPVMLITGTRKGIGRYLADYYSSNGFLVIGCSRLDSDLKSLNYEHFTIDISDENQVKKMFAIIRKKYKRLDVTINNAAIKPPICLSVLYTMDNIKNVLGVNFIGAFLICRESIKIMMKKSSGRIINISSMAVKHEVKGESLYASSKAALTTFSRVLSKEIYPIGITCNVIAPSAIQTDMSDEINQQALSEVLNRNAINSMGEMRDVINAANWLISSESQSITGQVIYLGGV